MSAFAMVIGLLLVGQVGGLDDRYSGSGPAQASGPRAGSAQNPGQGVVPLVGEGPPGSQAANAASQNAAATAARSGDPYSSGGGGNPNAAPPATGTSPPPFQGLETPPNGLAESEAAAPVRGLKPTALMRAMLDPPAGSQLAGQPVSLLEVVAGARSRLEQTQRVESYWDLCSSVADYYLGLREQEEVRRLRARATGGGTSWQQAEEELAVRMSTSLKAAETSQMRVAAWMGRGGAMPLPADQPHCGSYHSRYDEVFAGRPNAEAQQLAELLPLRYAELKHVATAVKRAEEWLAAVSQKNTGDGVGTLRALEFLALQRRAFVQIGRDYNRRIARYAELASPGEIGPDRLIGMLIKTDNSSTATRPASSDEYRRQSSNTSQRPPRTFAEGQGWEPAGGGIRDGAVRPTSGTAAEEPQRERSLLVSPRN